MDPLAIQGSLKSVFSNITVQKHQFFGTQLSIVQISIACGKACSYRLLEEILFSLSFRPFLLLLCASGLFFLVCFLSLRVFTFHWNSVPSACFRWTQENKTAPFHSNWKQHQLISFITVVSSSPPPPFLALGFFLAFSYIIEIICYFLSYLLSYIVRSRIFSPRVSCSVQ